MNRLLVLIVATCSIVLPLGLCGGCDESQEIVMTPEGTFTPSYLKGREIGQQYAEQSLPDYAVVWELFEVRTNLRADFLEGFADGLTRGGTADTNGRLIKVLQDAMAGNQFQTAMDLGRKHAARTVTNEQIQGTIHSSVGVSQGVALGWKAGYIKGFAAQRVADTAAAGAVSQTRLNELRDEAAATYHALRAAIGP